MHRPFDYVGKEKLDLSKQEHRDVVIERNKILEKHKKNGICIYTDHPVVKISIEVEVTASITCLVCGNEINGDKKINYDEFEKIHHLPVVKCSCCQTSYHYSKNDEAYQISLKK